jgi:hypothetical protein
MAGRLAFAVAVLPLARRLTLSPNASQERKSQVASFRNGRVAHVSNAILLLLLRLFRCGRFV